MMARKKEERSRNRRRKRNVDIINDNDDLIVEMLKKMREAAEVGFSPFSSKSSNFLGKLIPFDFVSSGQSQAESWEEITLKFSAINSVL